MSNANYAHAYAPSHRLVLLSVEDGIGIFEDVSSPYYCRVKCPMTPDYVIPYIDRSKIVEKKPDPAYVAAYYALMQGGGQ